jgi:taurine dioxygenase
MLTTRTVNVERLGVALGAQVNDVDLRRPVSPEVAEQLRLALDEHQVLAFRGQHDMTTEEQTQAASIWGAPGGAEPYRTIARLDGGREQVASVQKRFPGQAPFTDRWHADVTYSPKPPIAGTLYGELIPKVGGDTAFVSLCSIYDGLSEPMKRLCEGLQGEHSMEPMARDGFPIDPRMAALFPPMLHPLVQTHPGSGRKLIYITAENTWMQRIVGLHPGEAAVLLDYLRRQLDNIEYQFRWRWTAGDMLVWDQRAVNHMGMGDHYSLDPYRTVRSIWTYADDEPAARDPVSATA